MLHLCLLIVLSGCAVTRPPGAVGCQDYIDQLDTVLVVAEGPTGAAVFGSQIDLDTQRGFYQSLQDSLNVLRERGKTSLNILALSGGGQWGAFGAGFLNGWSEADLSGESKVARDEIDIVTGISTGALMSTYVFLGSEWDEKLTDFYLGVGPEGPDGIREDPTTDEDIFKRHGTLETFFSNAATDTRGRLEEVVKEAVSESIDAVGRNEGPRQIYVGAVNLEDGGFKIFNLKKLASDAVKARLDNHTADRERLEGCYSEMLLASAAVPYLFPPRFIDGGAYVDGGARFGTFIRAVDLLAATDPARPFTDKNIFVLINGDLQVMPIPRVDNDVLGIALRSVQVVIDQIYKDSNFRIEKEAKESAGQAPWNTHYVHVNETMCRDKYLAGSQDKEHEFDPFFMKCIYDLGRKLGREQAWLPFSDIPQRIR